MPALAYDKNSKGAIAYLALAVEILKRANTDAQIKGATGAQTNDQ
jgi:hypothetical protein